MARVWIITGASRGLGWAFADAAATSGDTIVSTARNTGMLAELAKTHGERIVPMTLDVNSKADCDALVAEVIKRFGKIDILVNNAGYGLRGAIEEVTENQVRDQMETNFFGAFWMTQAVLPHMREAKAGHILQISSMGGQIALPGLGAYHASKWALEGFTESLVQEVGPFGIKVTIVEPGGFRTDWGGSSMTHATQMQVYGHLPGRNPNAPRGLAGGDPVKGAAALMQVVNSPEPPLRAVFGVRAFDMVQEAYHRRLAEWDKWKVLARSTEWEEPAKG